MSEEAVQEVQEVSDVEQRARELGWRPEEELDEKPKNILGPQEYLERQDIVTMRKEISELKKQQEEQERYREMAVKAERNRVEREYKQKLREAVNDADTERYEKLERERDEALKEVEPPQEHPAVQRFKAENDWYNTDERMRAYADLVSVKLHQTNPTMSPEQHLSVVKEKVKEGFPDNFNKSPVQSVDSGRRMSVVAKGKKNFENMPKEIKDTCRRLEKKFGIKRDEYVRNYWDSQGDDQ